jgi:uncharacterized protein YcbK (DUF882 family)
VCREAAGRVSRGNRTGRALFDAAPTVFRRAEKCGFKGMNRRRILASIAIAAVVPRGLAAAPSPERSLHLINAHTGERFDSVFRDDQGPRAGAMDDLSNFLRDFHCNERIAIDVGVLDFLAAVMDAIGEKTATILSAYRTPATNEWLARTTFGVADNSQHMYGRALDVCFEGKLFEAMRAAREMRRGGVGWYPHSGFIHLDAGPVRNWDFGESGLASLISRDLSNGLPGKPVARGRGIGLSPELERSGRPLAPLKESGQFLSGLERSGRFR